MTTLLHDVAAVIRQLQQLNERLLNEKPHAESIRDIQDAVASLEGEFDLRAHEQRGRKRSLQEPASSSERIDQLQNKINYQSRGLDSRNEALRLHLGEPVNGRVCNVWFLRVGLSPPNVPARKLMEWCRDFNIHLRPSIGYGTVVRARDAMCEVVKEWNRKQIATSIALAQAAELGSRSLRIYMPHAHDEACFRMRSYLGNDAVGKRSSCLSRGPSSKVLNHVIRVNVQDSSLKWLH